METLLPALFFLMAFGPIIGALVLARNPKRVMPLPVRNRDKQ